MRQLLNAVQRAFILAEGNVVDADCLNFDASHALADPEPEGTRVTVSVGTAISDMERRLIYATLNHCKGRREKAAEMLGVSPKTLYNRLREYERERPAGKTRD